MNLYQIYVQYNDQWHDFITIKHSDGYDAMNLVRNEYKDRLEELTGNKIEYVNLEWTIIDIDVEK